jgi:HPt (histidine-containing phosphotransfer) domain-containing protein
MKFEEMLLVMQRETGLEKDDAISLYNDFFNNFIKTKQSLEESINCNDFKNIQRLAHQLNGTSANLRICSISDLALKLEIASKSSQSNLCIDIIKEISNQCELLTTQVNYNG